MSNTIDILTVVDAVSLQEAVASGKLKKGTKTNPTSLGSYGTSDAYIYMITANDYVVNDQAKSELTIAANVGDTVRWMITCPGGGTGNNVILMDWNSSSASGIIDPISLDIDIDLYVGSASVAPNPVEFQNYCFAGMLTKKGNVQYYITFQLLDEHGADLGFYLWDPFINVAN
ncbi:AidA/PixA family protein [Tenacibaculum sp. nBUS_03]|uniref:AidA/PixA family protein n=1 Tax=Tenacibaculum sp. nBUS_03 TaxID=3395320 RepID=UPI003EBD2820